MSSNTSSLLSKWNCFKDYIARDLFGGPRIVNHAFVINLQKGGTLPFVYYLMHHYDNFSPAAWTYLALHGSYGLCWLLKEAVFPDPGWQKPVTIGGAVASVGLVLGPYWVAPYLLVSQHTPASGQLIGGCIGLYALGLVTMMGSDTQKYFVLKERRGLITTGWFSRVRHPNYLGEMMIYGSFALLAQHPLPWAILAWVWTGIFLPNMLAKEQSMSRYPEWAAYKTRSGFLIPSIGL